MGKEGGSEPFQWMLHHVYNNQVHHTLTTLRRYSFIRYLKKTKEKLKNFTSLFKIQHLHFHLTHVYFNMFHKLHQSFQTFQNHHLHYSKCLKTVVCIIQKFYLCCSTILRKLHCIISYFISILISHQVKRKLQKTL